MYAISPLVEAPGFGPPPPETPSSRQGCARNALIGCGIAAFLLIAVLVGFFLYLRRNPGMMTDLMMRQIETQWGPDVTEQDKADLRAAYADFRTALNEKRVSQQGVQKIQFSLSGNRSGKLNREQVHQLTEAFRTAASGTTLPDRTPSVAPAPTSPP